MSQHEREDKGRRETTRRRNGRKRGIEVESMEEKGDTRGAEIQLVVFGLGKEEYGVDIRQVREIIKVGEITRVPKAPKFIEGIINLRGDVTPIMDLKRRLGLPESERDDSTRIIIAELGKGTVGMIVDSVTEVRRISEENIDSTPSITMDVGAEFIRGVGKIGERLLILLDLMKILSKKEESQLKKM